MYWKNKFCQLGINLHNTFNFIKILLWFDPMCWVQKGETFTGLPMHSFTSLLGRTELNGNQFELCLHYLNNWTTLEYYLASFQNSRWLSWINSAVCGGRLSLISFRNPQHWLLCTLHATCLTPEGHNSHRGTAYYTWII